MSVARGIGLAGNKRRDEAGRISSSPGRNRVLDGWRGLSVLGVVIGHAVVYRYGSTIPPVSAVLHDPAGLIHNLVLRVVAELGEVGVNFFFVISGFLITGLLVAEEKRDGRISIIAFYIRRCFRIMPAFYLYMLVIFSLAVSGRVAVNSDAFVRSGLYVCNASGFKCSWWLAHTWSLSVEEQFYLFWPVVFIILRGNRIFGITAITAVAFVLSSIYEWAIPFASIAIGAMVALRQDVQNFIRAVARGPVLLAAGLLILVQPLLFPVPLLEQWLRLIQPFLVALVLFGTVFTSAEGFIQRFLSGTVLVSIGLVSYSLYLWQQISLAPLVWGGAETGSALLYSKWPFLTVTIFGPLAAGSYFFVERPFIKIGHRLSKTVQDRKTANISASAPPVGTNV